MSSLVPHRCTPGNAQRPRRVDQTMRACAFGDASSACALVRKFFRRRSPARDHGSPLCAAPHGRARAARSPSCALDSGLVRAVAVGSAWSSSRAFISSAQLHALMGL